MEPKRARVEKLTPPDTKQCQALKPNGNSFMTLGGRPGRVRCTNKPDVIIKEKKVQKDGLKGSMSLCSECLEVFQKQCPNKRVTVTVLKKKTA